MSSGMSGEMRADPVSEKVRPVGSQKVRDSAGSTSWRGGSARAPQPGHDQAQPVERRTTARPPAAGPAGMAMTSCDGEAGDPHLGEPDRAARSDRDRRVVHVAAGRR